MLSRAASHLLMIALATGCTLTESLDDIEGSPSLDAGDAAAGAGGASGGAAGDGGGWGGAAGDAAPGGSAGAAGSSGAAGVGGGGSDAGPDAPVATISHPSDGEKRPANKDIPFIGAATDPQDGALSGASLVWTSDQLASPIGTGNQFSAALPMGTHVITLTATDSDSNQGTATITLYIE